MTSLPVSFFSTFYTAPLLVVLNVSEKECKSGSVHRLNVAVLLLNVQAKLS